MKHKLIMENWRRFVNEAALGFGGLSELEDMTFRIENDGGYYTITALDGSGSELGHVELDNEYVADCGIFVTHSEIIDPESGSFGPFLYDLAIELGSLLGTGVTSSDSPSGLDDPDSASSRSYAINVWLYYFNKRTDIEKYPISCTKMINTRHMSIIKNNAQYKVYPDHELKHLHKGWNSRTALKDPPADIQNKVNAINHFYRKDPIFLDQLKAMGKIEDTVNVLEESFDRDVLKDFFRKFRK